MIHVRKPDLASQLKPTLLVLTCIDWYWQDKLWAAIMTTFCTQVENGYNTSLSSLIKTCNIDFMKAETMNSVKIESKQICCFQRQVLCPRLCVQSPYSKEYTKSLKTWQKISADWKEKHINSQSDALNRKVFFFSNWFIIQHKKSAKSGKRMLKAFFFTMVNRPENLAEWAGADHHLLLIWKEVILKLNL